MKSATTLIAMCVGVFAFAASASASANEVFEPRRIDPDVWKSSHFQRAHPDLKHRVAGQALLEDGKARAAMAEFQTAASWGDKLSQAMLAELYWEGMGVRQDRPRAYAWMDLAAERQFLPFVAKREKYWAQLDAQEREAALAIGADVYAEFGDDIALPRLQSRLIRERDSTGSRLGFAGNGTVTLRGESAGLLSLSWTGLMPQLLGGNQMSLTEYYSPQLWRFDNYMNWHADALEMARRGVVRVGAVDDQG
jgi:hypothetical protein